MKKKAKSFNPPWKQERVAFGRRKDNSSFYNSTRWRKTSRRYRDLHPTCEMECKENDIVSPAEVCDHIYGLDAIRQAGRDPYDFSELQSGCHKCHNRKSGRESGGRGEITRS